MPSNLVPSNLDKILKKYHHIDRLVVNRRNIKDFLLKNNENLSFLFTADELKDFCLELINENLLNKYLEANPHEEDKLKNIKDFVIENLDKIKDPVSKIKRIWGDDGIFEEKYIERLLKIKKPAIELINENLLNKYLEANLYDKDTLKNIKDFVIENLDKIKDPVSKIKTIWGDDGIFEDDYVHKLFEKKQKLQKGYFQDTIIKEPIKESIKKVLVELINENLLNKYLEANLYDEDKLKNIKDFVIENLDKIKDPVSKIKTIWGDKAELEHDYIEKLFENVKKAWFPKTENIVELINADLLKEYLEVNRENEDKLKNIKDFIIENLDKIKDPVSKIKTIWGEKGELEHDYVEALYKEFTTGRAYLWDDQATLKLKNEFKVLFEELYCEGFVKSDIISGDWETNQLIARKKLKKGASLNADDILELTLEDLCDYNVDVEHIIEKIKQHGTETKDFVKKHKDGFSLLEKAFLKGNIEIAEAILTKKNVSIDVFTAEEEAKTNPMVLLCYSSKREESKKIFDIICQTEYFKFYISRANIPEDYFIYPMIALKNNNTGLANKFLNILEEKERNKMLLKIIYQAVESDDVDLIDKFFSIVPKPKIFPIEAKELVEKALILGHKESLNKLINEHNLYNNHTLVEKTEKIYLINNLLNIAYEKNISLEKEIKEILDDPTKYPDYESKIKDNIRKIKSINKSIKLLLKDKLNSYNEESGESEKKFSMLSNDPFILYPEALIKFYSEFLISSSGFESGQQNRELISEIIEIAKDNKFNLEGQDTYGRTFLMLAAQNKDKDIIEKLPQQKLTSKLMDKKDINGDTAIFYAINKGNIDVFKLLLDKGAKLRNNKGSLVKNKTKENPIMKACYNKDFDIISYILDKNDRSYEDLKEKDIRGNSAIHHFTIGFRSKSIEDDNNILKYLLNKGANIDSQNNRGLTPLMIAIMNNDADLVKILIENNADVNIPDINGNTPLIYAIMIDNRKIIDALLESPFIDINKKNNSGISAFVVAAQRRGLDLKIANKDKDVERIKEEINKYSPDPNHKLTDFPGIVDQSTYPELVNVLINKGADPYFFKTYDSFKYCSDIAKSLFENRNSIYLGPLVKVLSGFLNLVSFLTNSLKNIAIFLAYNTIYRELKRNVYESVLEFLTKGTELDHKIELQKDDLIIGSFHEGFFTIKYGKSLLDSLSNSYFDNTKNENVIYSVEGLQKKIGDARSTDENYCIKKYHDNLTNKYMNIKKRIEELQWYHNIPYIGKKAVLTKIANDILDADKLIKNSVVGERLFKHGDKEIDLKELMKIIRSTNLSKKLIYYILKNDKLSPEQKENLTTINDLINKILKKEIPVSPDVYYNFIEFYKLKIKLTKSNKTIENFLKKEEKHKLDLVLPNIDKNLLQNISEQVKNFKEEKIQSKPPEQKSKPQLVLLYQWVAGIKSSDEAAKQIAESVSDVSEYLVSNLTKTLLTYIFYNQINASVPFLSILPSNPVYALTTIGIYHFTPKLTDNNILKFNSSVNKSETKTVTPNLSNIIDEHNLLNQNTEKPKKKNIRNLSDLKESDTKDVLHFLEQNISDIKDFKSTKFKQLAKLAKKIVTTKATSTDNSEINTLKRVNSQNILVRAGDSIDTLRRNTLKRINSENSLHMRR